MVSMGLAERDETRPAQVRIEGVFFLLFFFFFERERERERRETR